MTEPQFSRSKDYYEILGVDATSRNQTEIKNKFMALCKKFHPDNSESGNSERFILVKEAYDVIKDPARRASYDRFVNNNNRVSGYPYNTSARPAGRTYNDFSDDWSPPRRPPTMDEQWRHIHQVYDRLNRDEERLKDEFRRRWREDERAWTYNHRGFSSTSSRRQIPMRPRAIVVGCFLMIGFGIVLNMINYNMYLKRIANQSIRRSHTNALETDHANTRAFGMPPTPPR